MSVDKELPQALRRLNRHGMPIIPLIVTTLIPIVLLMLIQDVETLSHLYAIGLVGAMIINLGSTATDKTVSMKYYHYCPTIELLESCNINILNALEKKMTVFDLKSKQIKCYPMKDSIIHKEAYEHWTDNIFSNNGSHSHARISPMC
jgi:hypothetical protein